LDAISCPVWRAVELQLAGADMGLRPIAAASTMGDVARSTAHLIGLSADVHHRVGVVLPHCLRIPAVRTPLSLAALHQDAKVLQGPDWKWGEQGDGATGVGVVVDAPTGSQWVRIRWESGKLNTYRWGHEGAVDLVRVRDGRVVAQALRDIGEPTGSGAWEAAALAILLDAFDQDRTGFIDHPAEVRVMPCAVFEVLESGFDERSGPGAVTAHTTYGLAARLEWRADALGFSHVVRAQTDRRWLECAPARSGLARAGQLPVGARVMRGPDWQWKDQDGGAGRLGTVVQAPTTPDWVRVAWDDGRENAYRWGHEDAHDVMLATAGVDSARLIAAVHASAWRGDPAGAATLIRPLMVSAYDFDRSGAVDGIEELNAVSCDVMRALETRYFRGGRLGVPLRAVYGLAGTAQSDFPAEALGFGEGVRAEASGRFGACGVL
jgi:hypothetical protein